MLKNLILMFGLMFFSKMAFGQGYGMAGCGLGSMLLGEKRGMMQVLAGTTNASFLSQTFGISTGTSNCTDGSGRTAQVFIEVNRLALANDIARGGGEALGGLGSLYGCQESLGQVLQGHYRSIFSEAKATSVEIDGRIRRLIRQSSLDCEPKG